MEGLGVVVLLRCIRCLALPLFAPYVAPLSPPLMGYFQVPAVCFRWCRFKVFCQYWSENNDYGHRPIYIAEGLIVHTHNCQPCDDILAMQMFANSARVPPRNSKFYLEGGIFFPE